MILKAGTYRFRNVLTIPVVDVVGDFNFVSNDIDYIQLSFVDLAGTEATSANWNLLFSDGLGILDPETKSAIPYSYTDGSGGWNDTLYQSITITSDTEVEDTFGTWYIANTNYNEVNAKPLAEITYNGETIAQLNAGETATLKCGPTDDTEYKMASDIAVKIESGYVKPSGSTTITENTTTDVTNVKEVVTNVQPKLTTGSATPVEMVNIVYPPTGYDGFSSFTVGADSPLPIEVADETSMAMLLESAEVGAIYKYTGETTDTYEKGSLYIVENDTISFTVDGTEYRAESGMTWGEWVSDTNYNTIGSEAVSVGVSTYISSGAGDSKYISYNDAFVTDDEEIVANRPYVLEVFKTSND